MDRMEQMQQQIDKIESQVSDLYSALMGSKITKDGGLVARVGRLEDSMNELGSKMKTLSEKAFKVGFYQWLGVSCIGGMAFEIARIILEKVMK